MKLLLKILGSILGAVIGVILIAFLIGIVLEPYPTAQVIVSILIALAILVPAHRAGVKLQEEEMLEAQYGKNWNLYGGREALVDGIKQREARAMNIEAERVEAERVEAERVKRVEAERVKRVEAKRERAKDRELEEFLAEVEVKRREILNAKKSTRWWSK